jgi:DNA modification methylase
MEQMKDDSVDLILTDPPYDFDDSTKRIFHEEFLRVCHGTIIVFSPPENQWILPANQYLFWVKPVSTKNTSKSYSRFVEMIFLYGGGYWDNTRHWSQYTNVFHDLVDEKSLHPYRKPVSLMERLVRNHSKRGMTVFDPFMGSGTTGTVCYRLGRDFIGCELEEKYYKMSERLIGGGSEL